MCGRPAASPDGVDPAESEQDEGAVEDAQRPRGQGHRAPNALSAPPPEGEREGEAEGDHPDDDARAEHRHAQDQTREGRDAERGDEQDQEFVVAREAVHDPDAEHRPVVPEPPHVDVNVLVLRRLLVAVAVRVAELREDLELPREADDPQDDEHDADGDLERLEHVAQERFPAEEEDHGDHRGGRPVPGRPT